MGLFVMLLFLLLELFIDLIYGTYGTLPGTLQKINICVVCLRLCFSWLISARESVLLHGLLLRRFKKAMPRCHNTPKLLYSTTIVMTRTDEETPSQLVIDVDVIVPVHNASETLEDTIRSAMQQVIPPHLVDVFKEISAKLQVHVCCYDDGSTDSSWEILCQLKETYRGDVTRIKDTDDQNSIVIASRLLIGKSSDTVSRGAGYARNRAAELRIKHKRDGGICNDNSNDNNKNKQSVENFLCMLDSDDVMHETRVAEQCSALIKLPKDLRQRTLLGCKFTRDPPDSTWHYSQWANKLTDERLHLERFREVTIIQPTWMMCRSRFVEFGGYIEAPLGTKQQPEQNPTNQSLRLIHPSFDTPETLRLAEDLRFFHTHLHANGVLRLHHTTVDPERPLVIYRHRANQSQSCQTSRKLLLHLRALAFEKCILQANTSIMDPWSSNNPHKGKFVIWGQGRDGKELVRALSVESRKRIHCFVDVDFKKIQQGFYFNRDLQLKIPIVHFSLLAKQPELRQQLLQEKTVFGRIDKGDPSQRVLEDGDFPSPSKRRKANHGEKRLSMAPAVSTVLDASVLPQLPVIVCVAMYRTNGALEENVKSVGREEGVDLWHFN
jgi:Glycosyl transferase family 2